MAKLKLSSLSSSELTLRGERAWWRNALVLLACLLVLVLAGTNSAAADPTARNVIILISDGCGYNHILATDYYVAGEAGTAIYEQFPVQVAVSTYADGGNYDPQAFLADFVYPKQGATDSAAAATAMSTGHKTYNKGIGIGPGGERLTHTMELAERLGRSTGVVTSVPFSHATPAGFVAHNPERDDYAGIATEMIYQSACDVIMGCGHPLFDSAGQPAATPDWKYVGSQETFADLTDADGALGADCNGDGVLDGADRWKYLDALEDFRSLMMGETPSRVFGLARARTTLQQGRPGGDGLPGTVPLVTTVPSLAEMTRGALNVLDADPDGFVLMIEGGAVDWASHGNQLGRMIEEMTDFNAAVEAVCAWVEQNSSWDETLVIVTADHETGYLLGPGSNPERRPIENRGRGNLPGAEWHSKSHTNQLVPLFAKGAGAQLLVDRATRQDPVRGAYLDNTDIASVVCALLQ